MTDRELHLATLMRAANRGDARAYRQLLEAVAPVLRGLARQGLSRYGISAEDIEDVVQETLLAVHLKRTTWDEQRPLLPWLRAIVQNKLVDSVRRRGHRLMVPIEDVSDVLAAEDTTGHLNGFDAERMLGRLAGRQRDIVQAISIEGASARQVADRLGMTEGAVRVMLHRALKRLAGAFRSPRP